MTEGGKRRANKSLKQWVAFVKKVAKEEGLEYRQAMMRAKARADKGEKWQKGGEGNDAPMRRGGKGETPADPKAAAADPKAAANTNADSNGQPTDETPSTTSSTGGRRQSRRQSRQQSRRQRRGGRRQSRQQSKRQSRRDRR